jgi:hypothetical protein
MRAQIVKLEIVTRDDDDVIADQWAATHCKAGLSTDRLNSSG